MIFERKFNILTEETGQENSLAKQLTALNHTATIVAWRLDRAIHSLMHSCYSKECVNETVVLTKQSAIEVLHTQTKHQVHEDQLGPRRWKVGNQNCLRWRPSMK